MDETARAKIIFDAIDIDDSGFIEMQELVEVLTLWGMGHDEAVASIVKRDDDKDGKISFDEFTKHYAEIYDFGIELLKSGYMAREQA